MDDTTTPAEPRWELYDCYVAYPFSAEERPDRRVAELYLAEKVDGNTVGTFTVNWTRLDMRTGSFVVQINTYADGAGSLARSGALDVITELGGSMTPDQLIAALVERGWHDRTAAIAERTHGLSCPTCGTDGYCGPTDVVSWRRKVGRYS